MNNRIYKEWRVFLYSRYGKEKTLGHINYNNGKTPTIPKDYKGQRLDGQPTTLSFSVAIRTVKTTTSFKDLLIN